MAPASAGHRGAHRWCDPALYDTHPAPEDDVGYGWALGCTDRVY